jgi:cyclic pyranopterin phosphate synthase
MFSHIDKNNQPTMVDVTDKKDSIRSASAQARIQLGPEFRDYLNGEELTLKKGPVFQTAIIAGTMAVKKTHELIPFCHQIPVEGCKFGISISSDLLITINCKVKTIFKTGVEIEALTGASVAALTVYDMCKAISHNILIQETKLLTKTGGKHTILDRPTYGLILTGGKSERMKEDKALINYFGKPHAQYMFDILSKYCEKVFLSARDKQWMNSSIENLPSIIDEGKGPISGMMAAFEKYPEVNWIITACDLIYFNEKTVEKLLANATTDIATAYRNAEKGFPEPLCAFYTPKALEAFKEAQAQNITCPVKVLKNAKVNLLDQEEGINLANINTQEERAMHAR